MDGNRDKKLPKIRELLAPVIIFDGYGGARCNVDPDRPCSYHQTMFSGGNFRRHILTKHPVEAAGRGFTACRRRDKSQPIPEFLANFIETNDAGEVHCRITNDQCRYSLPLFNLKRFQRHVCLVHPWEARQWNMTIEENGGSYPEQHQLILQSVTYDANGIYCRIDPESNCPYRLPVMNSRVFKLHFVNRHPEQAERNGITGEADEGPTTGRGVRTKALSTLVEENVYMDEEGYHCQLDPGCDYTVQGFCTAKLLDHFRQKHPALARAKGFFERRMSRMETDFNARIRKYAQKDDDGNFHCRIDGDCSFVQRKFSSHTFLRHFRCHHRRAANEKNFFEHLPKLARKRGGVNQRFASSVKKDSQYSEKVRKHTETDQSGTRCRIAGPICEYVQGTFRSSNFTRHFLNAHPKEAKEHGFFANVVTVVKSEFPHLGAGKQSKRSREKINYNKMVEDCIVRDISGSSCKISDDYCKYRQGKFDLAIFVAHFRKHHPAEAKARGFGVAKHGFKKLKMQEPVDPLAIKEEVGDDEELNPDEAPPSMRPQTSIHQLVEKNTLRVKTDVFCKISTEHCDYSRSEGFDSKDFVRHFRFKHPDEAREKGFFCEANDASSDDTLQHQKTLHFLVAENVLLDEEGIQCMISETACPFFQVTLNVYKFVSHFRSEHPSEAEEKGFLRRQRNRKKRKRKVVTAFGTRQRGSIRVLVEKHVKKNETGIHCSLTEHECQYVQTAEFRYPNFRRHFIAAHPVEARAAGFDVDRKKIHSWTRSSDKRAYRQLIRKCVKRDDAGIHCRIGPKECQYVQKSRYALSNFVRHFKAKHPKEARKKGFFKDEDTQKPKVRPHVDPSLKELIEAYIARDENVVHCRISQRPCRYVLKATCSYYNVVSHFRNAHPKEAMAAGFFPSLAAASEPDLESVERIIPDESDARDETMESFTREESQLENPCPDTKNAQQIPESLAKFVTSNDKGALCRITNGQCRYSQPVFNLKRFQRHMCLIHPWEALQQNLSIEQSGGSYPKNYQLVLQFLTYDANGIYCRMDPDSKCSYRLPTLNPYFFKRHFLDHHPEHAARYGITGDADDLPKAGSAVRTKTLSTLVEENVYMDERGSHCLLDPSCDFTVHGFDGLRLLNHFRRKHPALAKAKGFFEKKKSSQQAADVNGRIWQCTQKDDDGNFHCRIDGDCSFMQRKFSSIIFLHHFRYQHRSAAKKMSFCEKNRMLPKRNRWMKKNCRAPQYIQKVRQHTETDESGTRCRIAGLDCEYVQSTFRPGNFQRHFRNVHPKEAKQHGYFDDTSITMVKSEFGKPDAGNQPKRPDYGEMIEKHIMRDNLAIYCRISADYCRFRQFKFDLASFVRHFRKDHPKEARAKGFAKVGQTARKKIKKEAPVDPLAIKEEVEDDEEEQSDGADWGLLTPDEATPSMRPLTSIHELVEKNTLRVKTDVFCKISAEHCDYNRSEGFDSKDFVRHFRFKHPDEAREKGFFGEENEEQLPLERKSFRCLVMENVLVDEKGIHCMISETACPLFQIAFNVGNFVRHFRNEHAQLAEEKGFVRRKFLKKYRKQKRTAAEETSERVPYVAPISRRELVEKYVEKTETGIQCKLTDYCKHVQVKEFRYNNFYRHFISTHPVEAKAAGFFDDGRYLNYVATAKPGKLLYTQLVKKWTERDDIGTHCRIASSKCRYVQRYNYCSGNFVRHFRIEHPKEARKYGFFRDQDSDNEAPETESEAESVANEVKMESFSLEGNEPDSICPDAPQEHPLQRKNITFKELVMDYISSEGDGVHCRIAQRPCRYVQKGTFSYHNVVSHFRTAHPTEARAAGFFRNLAAASEPDLDSVERIIPDEPDARDETMESFTREESQLEIPCPDTFRDKPPEESHSEDQSVSQSQLTEKYILRDEVGVHCRISQWPCKYVQTGIYAYRNFVRHFRSIHPKEARKVGFFAGVNETSEPETEHESGELGEGQSMDPDTSDDERWKLKNGLPSLKRLTKKFIYQDAQGVYCRISAQPCRYIQRGEYKYTNFVRHFRTEHTAEATEAGFFRDHSEATEQESVNGTVEQEDSDTDIPLELDFGGKTGLIEIVAKCVYRNQKGIHCRISSSPCSYVQTSGFKYRNFISHFAIQHTEEASKAGFFRNDNDSSEPELEPVGGIAYDSITQDETMESFTTEQSQPENAEASQARALLWKKPSLKELAEKCIFRDENGAHCRIASWPCKYVQSSTFVVGNFVRHFRTEHPKEARNIGFFREKSKPVPVPAQNSRIEDVTLEPMVVEQSRPVEVLRPVVSQDKSKRRKNALTFTELAEKCIVRDEEGVHCRITPWPPCKYVQKSTFVVGNLVRHFRTEHPMEARKIGFFKESSESELDLTHDRASESFILEESQPEIPCPDTPCDDPALYCKLCFSVDLPLVPICSGPDAADNPLVESIEECINVRITADDDGWICSECSQKLVDFQQFRQLSRIHYSAVRRKKQQLATTTFSNPIVVHSANEADSFYVEIVKQENDIETHTEPPVTEQPCDDQKPFIELPNGSFSCRMCPQTFPSLGPTMEHFISAHSEAMTHTNSVLAVDYSDKPPFKPVTINNVQYLKCADCDTLTEHGEAIIEHRKRFHAGVKMLPTIRCDRVECEQFFMDNPAFRRHLEIYHDVIDPGEGGS